MKSFDEVIEKAQKLKNLKIAAVCAHDEEVIEALEEARHKNISDGILIGDKVKIEEICAQKGINAENFKIIDKNNDNEAAKYALTLVKNKKVDCIIKGKIKTSQLMKHIINKDYGILTGDTLSHVLILNFSKTNSFAIVSDGGMIINPTLVEKEALIKNALYAAKALELKPIKIALLTNSFDISGEPNNAAGSSGLSAWAFKNKYVNTNLKFEITGPVSFDEAVSLKYPANIFIMPNIEAGNIAGKALAYLADSETALLILGAKVPIVVTSRADNAKTKLNSIALASLTSKVKIRL